MPSIVQRATVYLPKIVHKRLAVTEDQRPPHRHDGAQGEGIAIADIDMVEDERRMRGSNKAE
jgi:hypothetical protein